MNIVLLLFSAVLLVSAVSSADEEVPSTLPTDHRRLRLGSMEKIHTSEAAARLNVNNNNNIRGGSIRELFWVEEKYVVQTSGFNLTDTFEVITDSDGKNGWCLDDDGKYYDYVQDQTLNDENECGNLCFDNKSVGFVGFEFTIKPAFVGGGQVCNCLYSQGENTNTTSCTECGAVGSIITSDGDGEGPVKGTCYRYKSYAG